MPRLTGCAWIAASCWRSWDGWTRRKGSSREPPKVKPEEAEAPLARAIALMELNRFPEAIDLLRRRRKLRDDSYLVDWHLAEALVKSGADADAEIIEALLRSIKLNAGYREATFCWARSWRNAAALTMPYGNMKLRSAWTPRMFPPLTCLRRRIARRATHFGPTNCSRR